MDAAGPPGRSDVRDASPLSFLVGNPDTMEHVHCLTSAPGASPLAGRNACPSCPKWLYRPAHFHHAAPLWKSFDDPIAFELLSYLLVRLPFETIIRTESP